MIIIVGDSNASSLDYKSDVLSIYYTFDTTYKRIRLKVNELEERELMLLRGLESRLIIKDYLNDYMYNDIRRIRIEALLLFIKEEIRRM